jgi:hypothetical protein
MKSVYVDMLKTNGAFLSVGRLCRVTDYTEEKTINKDESNIKMPAEDFSISVLPQALATKEANPFETYQKSYTVFSGCDIVITTNGKVMGEVQSITYASMDKTMVEHMKKSQQYADAAMLEEYPIAIRLEQAVFDRMLSINSDTDLVMSFANEYGQKAYMAICGLVQLMSSGDYSINSVVPSRSVLCAAKKIIPMQELKFVKDLPTPISEMTVGPIWNDSEIKAIRMRVREIIGKNNDYVTKCQLETLLREWCEREEVDAVYVAGRAKVESVIVDIGGCKYYV